MPSFLLPTIAPIILGKPEKPRGLVYVWNIDTLAGLAIADTITTPLFNVNYMLNNLGVPFDFVPTRGVFSKHFNGGGADEMGMRYRLPPTTTVFERATYGSAGVGALTAFSSAATHVHIPFDITVEEYIGYFILGAVPGSGSYAKVGFYNDNIT